MQKSALQFGRKSTLTSGVFPHSHYFTKYMLTCLIAVIFSFRFFVRDNFGTNTS